jgi:dihydrofolate reductase
MPNLIYSLAVSLDGYVAGPGGEIDWTAPDDELHRFHNARVREQGVQLCGRRLYEAMRFWDSDEASTSENDTVREFAAIWQALPKIVFSTTLDHVEGNATLARGGVAETVAELKARPGKDLAVGGAGLAATMIELGLVDEVLQFVCPVVLGGGTRFFPPLRERIAFELVETHTFGSRVVYLRYRRV